MRLGLVTPVVNLNPRIDPPRWERDGGMDDVVAVAEAAERLGYEWVSCPEHVAVPLGEVPLRGSRYFDPVVTLSFLAARTTRLRLVSYVTVLPYHHPLELVKRYGTLDEASGGRVVLGVGVGSLEGEFELLDVPFKGRGARSDDALAALRACFGRPRPTYHGTHYDISEVAIEPCGLQRPPPLWVGGRSARSLWRALALGDGWAPFGLPHETLAAWLREGPVAEALAERPDFELVLSPEDPLDPLGDPAKAAEALALGVDLGATTMALRLRARSRSHYLEQLEAMPGR